MFFSLKHEGGEGYPRNGLVSPSTFPLGCVSESRAEKCEKHVMIAV